VCGVQDDEDERPEGIDDIKAQLIDRAIVQHSDKVNG
jgi:hypothetical protein